jgi:GH24 family phage-related lysozyme (muramidase)
MRACLRSVFVVPFSESFEGGVASLYNDVRGKTTIAYGNLCDTPSEAAALPLVHPDGTFATTSEKIAAWRSVHYDPRCASQGWRYAARLTDLRLTRDGMTSLALARLDANDRILAAKLPDWESYPACAQLAMHSWAWACGANAHFPRLLEMVRARRFADAAVEIHMNEYTPEGIHNTGLMPRNVANKLLMRNAQRIEDFHLDPDAIEWATLIGIDDIPTVTELDNPASQPTIHVLRYNRGPDDPPDDAA